MRIGLSFIPPFTLALGANLGRDVVAGNPFMPAMLATVAPLFDCLFDFDSHN